MNDIEQFVHQVDAVRSPDLWSEIEMRRPRPPEPGPRSRHVAVAVLAVLISVGTTWLLIRTFGTNGSPPGPAIVSPVSPQPGTAVEISLPVGLVASSVDVGEGSAWVTARGAGQRRSGALVRIDLSSNQVVGAIPFRQPVQVQAVGDTVWVAEPGVQVLRRVDATTNQVVASIPLPGNWLSSMAADEAGVWVLTFSQFGERGPSSSTPLLVRIDPSTNEIVSDIKLDRSGLADEKQLQIGSGSIWLLRGPLAAGVAAGEDGGRLLRIDPITEAVTETSQLDVFAFSVGQGSVWVWVPTDGVMDSEAEQLAVRRIDTSTNDVSGPVDPGTPYDLLGADPEGIWLRTFVGPDGAEIRPVHLNATTLEVDVRGPTIGRWPLETTLDASTQTVWIIREHSIIRVNLV